MEQQTNYQTQQAVQPVEPSPKEEVAPISLKQMSEWYNNFVKFSTQILREGVDYGKFMGVEKACLFKAGAEKLRVAYKLNVKIELIRYTEDLTNNYLDYTYKASVYSKDGSVIGECEGNCNSYESKYRYIYVPTDKTPTKEEAALMKARKEGKWVRMFINEKNYKLVWHERILNDEVIGIKNTIMKMAQKRAFVGAILMATGASEFFTQDLEDLDEFTTRLIVANNSIETIEPEPPKEVSIDKKDNKVIVKNIVSKEPEEIKLPEEKIKACQTQEEIDEIVRENKDLWKHLPFKRLIEAKRAEIASKRTDIADPDYIPFEETKPDLTTKLSKIKKKTDEKSIECYEIPSINQDSITPQENQPLELEDNILTPIITKIKTMQTLENLNGYVDDVRNSNLYKKILSERQKSLIDEAVEERTKTLSEKEE